jgi:DNA-binding response OmpR family regulator
VPNQLRQGVRWSVESRHHFDLPLLRILIADGHAADSLALLLTLWGHEVEVARSGLEALDAVHFFRPDVLLAEIVLPKLDGLGLAWRLRREMLWTGTVLVALTGLGDPVNRQRVRQAGFHHHFVKPVAPDELRWFLDTLPSARVTPESTSVMAG